MKATARAEHLDLLVTQGLTPSWTIGAEALPGYIKPLINQLAVHRHSQATNTLQFLALELRHAAQVSQHLGSAQQMVLERLYDTNVTNYNASIARINELVLGDQTDCTTSLQRRVAHLQANPVTAVDTQNFLLGQHRTYSGNPTNNNNATDNQQAAAPAPVAGPSNNYQQANRARSPTPQGRGTYRFRGNPRGGPSRGRGSGNQGRGRRPRSWSKSRSRNSSHSGGTFKPNNLSPDELRVLQAYRESKS